jgi:hypothetical protein
VIARSIPKRVSQASNFAALVRYISNAHGKEERVGIITITNSVAETPAQLAISVLRTQLRNDRAKSDKTYHLLLSFPPGEQPPPQVLAQIEQRMCDALGFGGHQRISAVHHDTDALHVHVAVNKIHPARFTIHDPSFAYRVMAKTCLALEAEFGLIATNHAPDKTIGAGRAEDMDRIAGLEPLRDYIRRMCPGLAQAPTWQSVHDQLGAAGLAIKPQGAGLVILDGQGRGLRPSTVSRDLAKGRLEARLGPFEALAARGLTAGPIYGPAPSSAPGRASGVDTKALFARYTAEQAASGAMRSTGSIALTTRTRAELAAVRAQTKLQRGMIRLAPSGGPRAALRAVHAATHRAAVGQILAASHEVREKLRSDARAMGWLEWLQDQAIAGDGMALAALRARARAKPRPVAGVEAGEGGAPLSADSVTKTGVVIYRTADATVRDDGARLHVSRGVQDKGLLVALQIAKARHGPVLNVAGDASFQARVARLAALADPTIRFADPDLDRQRAAVAKNLEEAQSGGRIGSGPAGARASIGRGRVRPGQAQRTPTGPVLRRADGTRADRSAAELVRTAVRILRTGLPQLGRGGVERPEVAWHWPRLRDLSRSGLDDWRRRPSSLLPRAQSDHLDHARGPADADRNLQRQGNGDHHAAGSPSPRAGDRGAEGPAGARPLTPVQAYIAERNAKRASGLAIPFHAPFVETTQNLRFAGVRNIDGQALILMRADDLIMVMAGDAVSGSRVGRMKVGDPVRLKDGIVQGRARRR